MRMGTIFFVFITWFLKSLTQLECGRNRETETEKDIQSYKEWLCKILLNKNNNKKVTKREMEIDRK